MGRIFTGLLFLTLILGACSPDVAAPRAIHPSPTAVFLPPTSATLPQDRPAPAPAGAVTTNPQDCGYQWANQNLPELSSRFQQSMQALQPEARAQAYAFGENCLRADGSIASFAAMETDFNITLTVDDLANQSVLGRWIVQVMQVIASIPADQIAGPRPGRVSMVFQSNTDQSIISFYIDQYQELPAGLSHAEVYQSLQTPR